MRLVIVFAHAYLDWGYALVEEALKIDPSLELVALSATNRIYDKVQKHFDGRLPFTNFDIEALEKDWIERPCNIEKLKYYEDLLGPGQLNKIIIADRHIGQGYVHDSDKIDSLLSRKMAEPDAIKNYIGNSLAFFDSLFPEGSKSACFIYCVAGSYAFALGEIAKKRGAEFYQLQPSRIDNYYIMDTSVEGYGTPIIELYNHLRLHPEEITVEENKQASKWLVDFRNHDDVLPEYERVNRKNKAHTKKLITHAKSLSRACARLLYYKIFPEKVLYRATSPLQTIINSIMYPYRLWRLSYARWWVDESQLAGKSYILFPLHVTPEASTMVLAPDHTSQFSVIEALSKSAPLHMEIIVKEHPMMIGLRPLSFYKAIRALPNVRFIETNTNTQSLIKNSALIATITGTAGWEAIIRGKPLILFGKPPYSGLKEGFVFCPDLSNLPLALHHALCQSPCSEEALIAYIVAVYKLGLPLPVQLLWGGPPSAMIEAHQNMTNHIAQLLINKN